MGEVTENMIETIMDMEPIDTQNFREEMENQVDHSESEYSEPNVRSVQRRPKRVAKKASTKKRPQSQRWQEFLGELLEFKRKHGNCLVPHDYAENPTLARWVKRQRYQHNLCQQGKQSSITNERIQTLNSIGFVWDSHEASWKEKLTDLMAFKEMHGTCAVPATYKKNPRLATWVKCQRRQYKLLCEGKPANISAERILDLKMLGFEWESRSTNTHIRETFESAPSDYEFMLDVLSLLSDDSVNDEKVKGAKRTTPVHSYNNDNEDISDFSDDESFVPS